MHPEAKQIIKDLEIRALVADCVLRHADALAGQYIVLCQGIPVNPTPGMDGFGFTGTPTSVQRFSKAEAERIAPRVLNGNKVRGVAVSVVDAIAAERDEIRATLELLRIFAEKGMSRGHDTLTQGA